MASTDAGADAGRGGESHPDRVTPAGILALPEARQLIDLADEYLNTVGYTDHGISHISRVSRRAGDILRSLGRTEREAELAEIAGLLHDIGNLIHREEHPQSSALMAFQLLREMGMPLAEVAVVAGAIGNHDEGNGDPVSAPGAALIISDKSDVTRSRVRNRTMIHFDIHDRVNYAAEQSRLTVEREGRLITLELDIDTSISTVMEYFEIFLGRMKISRRAANYLNCDFRLVINGVALS